MRASQRPLLFWEELPSKRVITGKHDSVEDFIRLTVLRARVPGGWLVMTKVVHGTSLTFMPDPEHAWDGGSLDEESVPESSVRRTG